MAAVLGAGTVVWLDRKAQGRKLREHFDERFSRQDLTLNQTAITLATMTQQISPVTAAVERHERRLIQLGENYAALASEVEAHRRWQDRLDAEVLRTASERGTMMRQ